jgi:indolepyruvate ferredoxin oxidoreductase alpha subunit
LTIKIITGNQAIALGALQAGARILSGYPGTPSTGAIAYLLTLDLPDRHVEWSVNEKVALEIAAGAAWAGHRSLCTMKMSGVNVAYDSLASISYSGVNGGMVIYVADDPGVSAGMCEQDTRVFARMADLPILEPSSVSDAYDVIQKGFELSESVGTPVFVRMVTALANSYSQVEIDELAPPPDRTPILERDIARYTKAGSAICLDQHQDLIDRLEKSANIIEQLDLNSLHLSKNRGGLGIIAAGVLIAYLDESLELATGYGLDDDSLSILKVRTCNPFPVSKAKKLLAHCDKILVLEELEPILEQSLYVEAFKTGYEGQIIGKLDGPFSRIGTYDTNLLVKNIAKILELDVPESTSVSSTPETLAAARPITFCAGCPHRGTYMALNQALKKLRFKKDEVMITGDIGCTILGMNPPFNTVLNEVSMGASVGMAQGFVHSGLKTPVIATMGDSTFFHGGIPGLVNAIQHQTDLTLIILDNGWTAMTGMQVNPGTSDGFQEHGKRVDIAKLIPALGVSHFSIIDPFNYHESVKTIQEVLPKSGVKVILSRQECAIQAIRQGKQAGKITVDAEKCNLCKLCILTTGCPAISIGEDTIVIDQNLCYGCGLCADICNREAILREPC